MSTFTSFNDACVALQTGKADKATFLGYVKSRQGDTTPILKLMVDKVLTMADVSEIIASQHALAASAAAPKLPGSNGIYFKVSEKGGVSVYGLQRMPVTLYGEQWERLLSDEHLNALREFIKANKSKLSTKADKVAADAAAKAKS